MIYRNATKNDLKQIIMIKNRVKERVIKENLPIWLNGYPTDDYLLEDVEKNRGRVIDLNNKIVAYSMLCESSEEYAEFNLFDTNKLYSFGRVMVDDNYTGLGIGKFLISNILFII